MPYRIVLLTVIILWALTGCNLTSGPRSNEPIATQTIAAAGKPTVTIVTPNNGDEVVVDDKVLVSANASDPVGVTRVQLLANGQIVKTVSSEAPTGDQNLNVLLDYTPREAGVVNLQVIAYRSATASDPASVQVNVRANQAQVTATPIPQANVPVIDPNDPTCRVLVNVGLNLRTGPGTNYDKITVLAAGRVVPIMGRLGTNEWWQVRSNTTIGWVSAAYTTVYGNCSGIPVVAPPPTPTPPGGGATATPAPTFTPTFTPIPSITPGPADLVVSTISGPTTISIPPGKTDTTGTYTVTVTNTGGSGTGQFNNIITLSPGNLTIPLGVVAGLNPGESIVLSADVTFTSVGSYTLQARTDSNNQVTEQSEVNNVGIYTVTITAD